MNIGIDARLWNETGVGRYIRNLIVHLAAIDTVNTYTVYLLKGSKFPKALPARFSFRSVSSRWHTLAEQIEMAYVCSKDRLDLLHVPYFTVPLLYPGKIVTTVHDLTILRVQTGKASTLPLPLYLLKKAGYRFVLTQGLRKAVHILSVSQTTKQDLLDTFLVDSTHCTVTYEGVDSVFFSNQSGESLYRKPFVLYVGNAYPHKNLRVLLSIAKQIAAHRVQIVCVGPNDYFYSRFQEQIMKEGLSEVFDFPKGVTDTQLRMLYSSAHVCISPSYAEGFALPPLEALAADCPLIVSDIPVFRELLPATTEFVDPGNVAAWANTLERAVALPRLTVWKSKSEKSAFFSRYSWEKMAAETLRVYEDCFRV